MLCKLLLCYARRSINIELDLNLSRSVEKEKLHNCNIRKSSRVNCMKTKSPKGEQLKSLHICEWEAE